MMMPGSSDGGAHLLSFCGADYTTRLLTEWSDVLTIEAAVARISGEPARAQGLTDRGVLREGLAADVLVIDRDALARRSDAALRATISRPAPAATWSTRPATAS